MIYMMAPRQQKGGVKELQSAADAVFKHEKALRDCVQGACPTQADAAISSLLKKRAPISAKIRALTAKLKIGKVGKEEAAREVGLLEGRFKALMVSEIKTRIGQALSKCTLESCGPRVAEYVACVAAFFEIACAALAAQESGRECTPGAREGVAKLSTFPRADTDDDSITQYGMLNMTVFHDFVELLRVLSLAPNYVF
jgi:hypothetical protein